MTHEAGTTDAADGLDSQRDEAKRPAIARRLWALGLLMVVVALGLGSRRFGAVLPGWVAAYAGDTLWGVMWFVAAGVIGPHARPSVWAGVSLAWTWGIEFSQLYHAPWIDAVRRTLVGRYLLGNTFLWSDIVCCGIGVALAWVVVVAAKAFVGRANASEAAR